MFPNVGSGFVGFCVVGQDDGSGVELVGEKFNGCGLRCLFVMVDDIMVSLARGTKKVVELLSMVKADTGSVWSVDIASLNKALSSWSVVDLTG